MPNLVVDRGNHSLKLYIFSDGKIISREEFANSDSTGVSKFISENNWKEGILSSVVASDDLTHLATPAQPILRFDNKTPTPLKMNYATPDTLGPDRIAASLAGWQLSGGGNVLTIVAGTCITYNVVHQSGSFEGGAISPGLHMRLRAMHEFTGKLPLVDFTGEFPLTGYSTETSIRSGALNGAVQEVKGMIHAYEMQYPGLKTVISGGDGAFLAEALKNGIFARPELVAEGLNTILNYNVANRLAR